MNTSMGEIAPEEQLPSLLITDAPRRVGIGEPFKLEVSTRNLVRDRFLGAAAGGYYLESSFLNGAKLQRGHFHTACRMPGVDQVGPRLGAAPEFFLATQDNGGGKRRGQRDDHGAGTATKTGGIMQCTSWAGDGSHRTPDDEPGQPDPGVRLGADHRRRRDGAGVDSAAAEQEMRRERRREQRGGQADADQAGRRREQAAAGAQAPDQDGAVQPLPAGVGTATSGPDGSGGDRVGGGEEPAAEASRRQLTSAVGAPGRGALT